MLDDAEGSIGFQDLGDQFGKGYLFSYYVIIEPKDPSESVFTDKFFNLTNQLIKDGQHNLVEIM